MSDPNLILKDTGSVEQTNRLVCMYAETVFHDEQTLRHIFEGLGYIWLRLKKSSWTKKEKNNDNREGKINNKNNKDKYTNQKTHL